MQHLLPWLSTILATLIGITFGVASTIIAVQFGVVAQAQNDATLLLDHASYQIELRTFCEGHPASHDA